MPELGQNSPPGQKGNYDSLKGTILEKLSRYEEAIESYQNVLKYIVKGKNVDISFNLAVAYFNKNEFSKAKEIFMNIYPRVTDTEMKKKIDEYLRMIK